MGCGSSTPVQATVTDTDIGKTKPTISDVNVRGTSVNRPFDDKPTTAVENSAVASQFAVDVKAKFSLQERVHVLGYTGNVRFIGSLSDLGEGQWIGIELDHKHPQGNDGNVNGVQYFSCPPRHGMFARSTVVFHHTDVGTIDEMLRISPETVVFIQTNMRRFLTRIRLRNFHQRSGTEKEIDAFLLNTPKEEAVSVERLGNYLTRRWRGERNKAYAIFRWLTLHVDYDVKGFFGSSQKKSCDAESVLRNRSAVCAGYANLFESLCKVAGLDAHTVEGYAKGYGYQPGQQFTDTNHAWNALRVNGEWFVCDSTWGTGYLGADLLFQRSLSMAMFLMDPEYAIHSHFPVDERWQLLDKPIAKEEFEKLVVPSGKFHEMGVDLLSHKESIYEVDAYHIEMMFYSPSLKILRASLKDNTGKDVEGRKRTQIFPCGVNQVKLRAQFPVRGKYKLNLYVTDSKVDNRWHQGVQYIIHAKEGVGNDQGGFPQLGNSFYTEGFHLDHPLENIVSQDGQASISLQNYNSQISKINGHLEIEGNKNALKHHLEGFSFCFPEKTKQGFKIQVHLPMKGNYELKVFAKYFGEGRPDTFVCAYQINALTGLGPIPGFPRISETFDAWALELLEPRENVYSRDGRASVQLRSPNEVSIFGYMAKGKQNLDNSLTCSREKNGVTTIQAHAPEPGTFKLHIFGRKNGSVDSEYLATFMIKSDAAAGANPGFPCLKDEFKEWGLELVNRLENITSRDRCVMVTFLNPKGIAIKSWLFDEHNRQIGGPCAVETIEHRTTTTCEVAAKGMYKLNVFGTNHSLDKTKQVHLCTYKILYPD